MQVSLYIDLWNLFIAVVSLSKNNDLGFISIQKINFSNSFPFNCNRKQIWP